VGVGVARQADRARIAQKALRGDAGPLAFEVSGGTVPGEKV
jgi:hypothetical protein